MKAVILAAGIASRLRPLTNNTPKCLLKAGNKFILELTIDNIVANGINDVLIVTGYLQQQIKNFVSAKYPDLNMTYIYNEMYDSTNNIYSLWLAKEYMLSNEVLLMDSDIIFDREIITSLLASGHDNCLALKRYAVDDEEIKVKVNEQGKVIEIGKEVKVNEAIGESIGIEKFGEKAVTKLFENIDRKILVENSVDQFYEAAFQEMVDNGTDIFTVSTGDHICMEIDTAADLEAAAAMLLKPH